MDWKIKTALALTLLAAAAIGGCFLAGYLTLTLLRVSLPLSWNTWLLYWQAIEHPQVAPYAWRIKLAGGIGFGAAIFGWLAFVVPMLRKPARSLHGEARFATVAEVAKAGLFNNRSDGIVVGKLAGRFIRLVGQQFALLAAPTRSGKGVSNVTPNLMLYGESVVVLDIKQENHAQTSGCRLAMGQDVYMFNPFAEDRRTHRWNPLSYVTDDKDFRISDVMSIGESLYPDTTPDNKFWVSQARNAFVAFALYLFEKRDKERNDFAPIISTPTLGHVFRLSSGTGGDLKGTLRDLSRHDHLGSDARQAFANLTSQEGPTFSSIMGMFREPLNAFLNPVLDAATSGDDFLLTDVRRKKMTVYVCVLPNKLAESRVILNLFFSQLIKVNTKEMPSKENGLKHQCLLLMDEFTSIGKIDILADSVAYIAGYNLRLLTIIQSLSQLDAVYGQDVARSFVTNHALQIIFTPREQRDANEYSEMLGHSTVRTESLSRGRDVSKSYSDQRRALMLPQELKAMSPEKEIIMFEGIGRPVMCKKIRYYKDRKLKKLVRPPAEVPRMKL
ncbi:type IV secretion system protein VirD4 [Luteibacter sp. UNCMF331Sha3.1]|uniref:type IV secretory system conjugative DNA transfer family protein n=1 Tax=Luteibacter sp. UNCMF331Sha3.1 TaxID=1502760 RepID=UPI0008AB3EE7|nr:type IV secretory system conjugative DNA transfer family protein [Luteibacter sp. UNCMF331Sha3.1]SEM79787.1 type IV secretion system protein VirD4 [Luteibacter sp. UNCMF331Sha3.1]